MKLARSLLCQEMTEEVAMSIRIVPALVLGLLFVMQSGVASAQAVDEASETVRNTVITRLQDTNGFEHVTPTVEGGVVTLEGEVASLWHVDQAIERVRKARGVQSVISYLTVVRGETDESVRNAVAGRIRAYVHYSIFDSIDLSVVDGALTLSGYVTEEIRVRELGRLASRVTGVRTLDNRIEVLPASVFDAQLRRRLAGAIYGHPLFSHLSFQTAPPLHIVVKNSNVILTGVVNSEAQRTLAEHIVLSTFGVLGVENHLRLDSEMTGVGRGIWDRGVGGSVGAQSPEPRAPVFRSSGLTPRACGDEGFASPRITLAEIVRASACGQSTSSPTPFRKIPRTITR